LYFRNRFYSPMLGRFVQRDPVRRRNLYEFVSGSPTSLLDPLGLEEKKDEKTWQVTNKSPLGADWQYKGNDPWLPTSTEPLTTVITGHGMAQALLHFRRNYCYTFKCQEKTCKATVPHEAEAFTNEFYPVNHWKWEGGDPIGQDFQAYKKGLADGHPMPGEVEKAQKACEAGTADNCGENGDNKQGNEGEGNGDAGGDQQ